MTITIYELLGLVKDGKAPKKIKYGNREYYLYDNKSYLTTDKTRFFDKIYFSDLNEGIEILEEENKIEKIEIVNNGNKNAYAIYSADGTKCALTKHSKTMCDKINELIDEINKLKEDK